MLFKIPSDSTLGREYGNKIISYMIPSTIQELCNLCTESFESVANQVPVFSAREEKVNKHKSEYRNY